MRRIQNYGGPMLATCLALTGLTSALADTTTVTTKTTTVESSPSFLLPTSTYVVVDPLTGVIKGEYVNGTRVIEGVPLTNNYVVMDKVTRRLVGTFDTKGNLIDINAAPAATDIVVSVDSHRTSLEKEIDRLLLSGQITNSQADALRMDIAKLFPGASATTVTKTVTYNNALAADSGLYTVESRLLPLQQKSYTSKVIEPRFISVNGQLVLPDSLDYRKLQLERRIEEEFAFGHLTKDQLIQLKADMTEISNKEAQFRVNNGGALGSTNSAIMAADLNAVQSKMEQYVASVNAGLKIGVK